MAEHLVATLPHLTIAMHWFKENQFRTNTRQKQPKFRPVISRTWRFNNSPISYLTGLLNKKISLEVNTIIPSRIFLQVNYCSSGSGVLGSATSFVWLFVLLLYITRENKHSIIIIIIIISQKTRVDVDIKDITVHCLLASACCF